MSDFITWLRGLAEKGGKGVVKNIDARSLGRIADEMEAARRRITVLEMVIREELYAFDCGDDANRMIVDDIRERYRAPVGSVGESKP